MTGKTWLKQLIKKLLGDNNESFYTLVEVNGTAIWLSVHDMTHLEVSRMPVLPMGKAMVTGIGGVCIKQFGNAECTPQYSGYLDECRVAIHQALASPSPCGYARLMFWITYMVAEGIDPIKTILLHRSML